MRLIELDRRVTVLETNYLWIRWMVTAVLGITIAEFFGVRIFDMITLIQHP